MIWWRACPKDLKNSAYLAGNGAILALTAFLLTPSDNLATRYNICPFAGRHGVQQDGYGYMTNKYYCNSSFHLLLVLSWIVFSSFSASLLASLFCSIDKSNCLRFHHTCTRHTSYNLQLIYFHLCCVLLFATVMPLIFQPPSIIITILHHSLQL